VSGKRPIVRTAIYGAGSWANRTHIPNLLKLDGVQIAAVCDVNGPAAEETAHRHGIARSYADGHTMLGEEEIDVLFSCVPAYARADVEAAAAGKGIHLFSEKPQATTMAVARRIDEAVRCGGVLSTVCFRERYRPIFQEARRLLSEREVVHVRFTSPGGMPARRDEVSGDSWHHDMERAGGRAFDWGVHAVDYIRFMSGLDVTMAQAYYHHPSEYVSPLSCSFNLRLSNGGTATLSFMTGTSLEPWFTFYYDGGHLALHRYDSITINGETVYEGSDFDPWLEQDRVFVEAVRSGDGGAILNDYHDGLFSLAPILAGWESARRNGECVDVAAFMAA